MVRRVDEKNHATDIAKRMVEHEPLHLAVVLATPMRPGEKGPADFDLIGRLVIAVKARRSDRPTGSCFHRKEGSPGVQRLLKEAFEASRLGTGLVRVLLPDAGARSNG